MSPPAVIHDVPDDDLIGHEPTERCVCGTTREPLDPTTRDDGTRAFVIRHARLERRAQP